MSTISATGLSPYDVIAFIQEHTQVYSSMIKEEMGAAQDRTALVKDIADLEAGLEACKSSGDWKHGQQLIGDFMNKHPETWGGGAHDMVGWFCNTGAWAGGKMIDGGSYKQQNFANGATYGESFHSDYTQNMDLDGGKASAITDEWMKNLDAWKDSINSDDKIGLMTLQEHAEDLKNLYEVGSNVNAKTDQTASLIISNIGKG